MTSSYDTDVRAYVRDSHYTTTRVVDIRQMSTCGEPGVAR